MEPRPSSSRHCSGRYSGHWRSRVLDGRRGQGLGPSSDGGGGRRGTSLGLSTKLLRPTARLEHRRLGRLRLRRGGRHRGRLKVSRDVPTSLGLPSVCYHAPRHRRPIPCLIQSVYVSRLGRKEEEVERDPHRVSSEDQVSRLSSGRRYPDICEPSRAKTTSSGAPTPLPLPVRARPGTW